MALRTFPPKVKVSKKHSEIRKNVWAFLWYTFEIGQKGGQICGLIRRGPFLAADTFQLARFSHLGTLF